MSQRRHAATLYYKKQKVQTMDVANLLFYAETYKYSNGKISPLFEMQKCKISEGMWRLSGE